MDGANRRDGAGRQAGNGLCEVLVVGAGPVGLSLAIELGLRSVNVQLIERELTRGPQPRAKTLNMRSLEHFRRWGVADAVRAASPVPSSLPTDVVFQTRLFGSHIATIPSIYFRGNTHADDPRFNEPSEWVTQNVVEQVLMDKARSLPSVTVRRGMELVSLDLQGDSVSAILRGSGGEEVVEALYLAGCDGARSIVREELGIKLSGRHAFAANYNVILRIPELDHNYPEPHGIMHWILNPDSPAIVGPVGENWYLAKQLAPGVTSLSDEELKQAVTGAFGRELDYEVVVVDPWYAHQLIADSYRQGHVFLAGDACHLHPPFGGYGMNMGIADGVDLGWKLAAVVQGWGGEDLLDSYEIERRRVHEWTIAEAVENYRLVSNELHRPGLEDVGPEGDELRDRLGKELIEQKQREFHTIGLVLGYHYAGSAVIACTDELPAPETEAYDPKPLCGALAPHVWLSPGRSLYDAFGLDFTLLDTTGGAGGAERLESVAATLDVPLTTLMLDDEAVRDLYGRALTLVRPDQHIAWRGENVDAAEARRIWDVVTGRATRSLAPPAQAAVLDGPGAVGVQA